MHKENLTERLYSGHYLLFYFFLPPLRTALHFSTCVLRRKNLFTPGRIFLRNLQHSLIVFFLLNHSRERTNERFETNGTLIMENYQNITKKKRTVANNCESRKNDAEFSLSHQLCSTHCSAITSRHRVVSQPLEIPSTSDNSLSSVSLPASVGGLERRFFVSAFLLFFFFGGSTNSCGEFGE